VLESRVLDPLGSTVIQTGTAQTGYGFTGEMRDDTNGLLYLRARYYNPALGVFTALDPFEGVHERAMSLNGYSWVEGNVVNAVDPSGMITDLATAMRFNAGLCLLHFQSDNTFTQCEQQCADLRPTNFLQELLFGWQIFQGCVDQCVAAGIFAPTPFPPSQNCNVFLQGENGATGSVWEAAFPVIIPSGIRSYYPFH
jgi:RHS repeat-associated protein